MDAGTDYPMSEARFDDNHEFINNASNKKERKKEVVPSSFLFVNRN